METKPNEQTPTPVNDQNPTPPSTDTVDHGEQNPQPVPEKKANSGSAFYKQKIEELQKHNNDLVAQMENQKIEALKSKENFKELYELEKQKREKAEQSKSTLTENVYKSFKSQAIKEAARKYNIMDSAVEDLDLLDNSLVEIETTDRGTINVLGAEEFMQVVKEKKPHWFKNTDAPNININQPSGDPGSISASDLIAMQKKDPTRYQALMKKRLGFTR